MTFVLAVSQAPHNSWLNGQDGADARQYFIRPTQTTWYGPRIDTAIAGMTPGQIVGPILSAAGSVFTARDPTDGGTLDTLQWTPYNAWHAGTQQLVHGGMRKLNKISIYSDVTGEYREEVMPEALAQYQMYGHWYGRTATDGVKVLLAGYFYYPETGTWSATSTGLPGWNTSYAWFPEYGTAGGWVSGSTTLSVYDEASGTVITHGNIAHDGHDIKCYHPAHEKVLVLGGSDTPLRATLISPDGSFVQVSDAPVTMHMEGGAQTNIVAHPSGCWLAMSNASGARTVYAYWPVQDAWQTIGALGGPTITYSTLAWDDERQIAYLSGTQGLFAWKLPAVTEPGGSLGIQGSSHSHTLQNVTLSTSVTLAIASMSHASAIEAPALTADMTMAAADLEHSHTAESPTLSADLALIAADLAHAGTINNVSLTASTALEFAADGFGGTTGQLLQDYDARWIRHPSYSLDAIINAAGMVEAQTAEASLGTAYRYDAAPASADYSVSADFVSSGAVTTSGPFVSLNGRMDASANTMYRAGYSCAAGQWQLYRLVTGTLTMIGSVTQAFGTSTTRNVRLEMIGDSIRVYLDGSATPSIDYTDATPITAAGYAGIRIIGRTTPSIVQLDNFSAENVAAANFDLTVAGAQHATASDSVTLQSAMTLIVADATHAHALDALTLSAALELIAAGMSHAHTIEAADLLTGISLDVQGATHAHTLAGLSLETALSLAIADALHGNALDAVALETAVTLLVNDALHSHALDNVGVFIPAVGSSAMRTLLIAVENRALAIRAENRIRTIQ